MSYERDSDYNSDFESNNPFINEISSDSKGSQKKNLKMI